MTYTSTVETKVRDASAVEAACRRLQLPPPAQGVHDVDNRTYTGLAVQLPGWRYPVVCDLDAGQLHYDNHDGHWGEQKHLDAFLQSYAVEKAKIEANRLGYSVTEQESPDGTITLRTHTGGAA